MWKVLRNRNVKPEIAQTRENEREEQMLFRCTVTPFFVEIWLRFFKDLFIITLF